MIDVYSWPTSNGHKVHIALEECGLAYRLHPIDLRRGDQRSPAFTQLNPNQKIPVIVDADGPGGRSIVLAESGAILVYLATKSGRLLPRSHRERYKTLEWLLWQVSSFGPTLGQLHHFAEAAPDDLPYVISRFHVEARRLYGVLDGQLDRTGAFVSSRMFTIADVSIWTWARWSARQGVDLSQFPRVRAWFDRVADRPAVKRGISWMAEHAITPAVSHRLPR
jgi:GST-like protein